MKHSQSFSPFCDSISADIAPVSLDSSIWSDEDAAEGNIFIRGEHKDGEEERARDGERGIERRRRNEEGHTESAKEREDRAVQRGTETSGVRRESGTLDRKILGDAAN